MNVSHVPNSTQTWHTAGIPYGVNKLLIEAFTEAALENGKGKCFHKEPPAPGTETGRSS